jgi:WKF domain
MISEKLGNCAVHEGAECYEATLFTTKSAEITMALLADSNEQSASDTPSTRRIPAWKRLGLKLKFSTDNADQHTQLESDSFTNRKRLRDEDPQKLPEETRSDHKVKKKPRLDPTSSSSTKTNGTAVKILSPSLRRESNGMRKTVSFTSDTKVEDGDSSRSLIADWEAQYDQPPEPEERLKDSGPVKNKISKPKKSKSRPIQEKPNSALEYLTLFHQSRERWKFNKNKEIWILKHLFSVDAIPSDYDVTLSQYLRGLKSSAARERISREAEKIVQEDQEHPLEYTLATEKEDTASNTKIVPTKMEDPERRRAYYDDSVRRYKRKLEQHLDEVAEEELNWVSPERLAKRRRAEITLWAIGVTPSIAGATQSSHTTVFEQSASRDGIFGTINGGRSMSVLKKRKNRTSVVVLSSSSSDDETSDSSTGTSDESSTDEETSRGGEGEESNDESESESSQTSTTARTQTSVSRNTGQESSSDQESESSLGSSGSSDQSVSDTQNGALTNRRQPRSIISISS